VPVSAAVQTAVSQRYARLADAIMNGHKNIERALLAPHFIDAARVKLRAYEYDPLTIVVRRITVDGATMTVFAQYVGSDGRSAHSLDTWQRIDGAWRLVRRNR
jgi:hypothetical protein